MFFNIRAEQARNGLTNGAMAKKLGLTRPTYEKKLKTGSFVLSEIVKLCNLFNCSFEYLFATENEIAETKEV